jgi:hypothetical protein
MATELAKAYVQIIPSAEGIQGQIADALSGEADSAGKSGGKKYASGFGAMTKKALVGLGACGGRPFQPRRHFGAQLRRSGGLCPSQRNKANP